MQSKSHIRNVSDVIVVSGDSLAEQYKAKLEHGTAEEREAVRLLTIAEDHLNQDEDHAEAFRVAVDALGMFRKLGDNVAAADTLRLIIRQYKLKAEMLRYSHSSESAGVQEALNQAESIANKEIGKFRAAGDPWGVGMMYLSIAEINFAKRGDEKRDLALHAANTARDLFKELKVSRFEAEAYLIRANVYIQKMELQDALKAANEALPIFRDAGTKLSEAKCLHVIAMAHFMEDRFQDAIDVAVEALDIFKECASLQLAGFEAYNIATWYLAREKPKGALPYAHEAVQIFEITNYSKGWRPAATALLVQVKVDNGDIREGIKLAEQGLKKYQKSGDVRGQIITMDALTHALLANNDPQQAFSVVQNALQACRELGDRHWESKMLRALCTIQMESKNLDKALKTIQDAQLLCQQLGDRSEEAIICSVLARVHIQKEDLDSAMSSAQAQGQLFQEAGERNKEAFAMLQIAEIRGMQGKLDKAIAEASDARKAFQEVHHLSGEGSALRLIADIELINENFKASRAAAEQMLEISKASGNSKMQARAQLMIAQTHLQEGAAPQKGLDSAKDALVLAQKADDKRLQVEVLNLICRAHLDRLTYKVKDLTNHKTMLKVLGEASEQAVHAAEEAVKVSKKINDEVLIATSLHAMSTAHLIGRNAVAARKAADEAAAIFIAKGDKAGELACDLVRADACFFSGNLENAKEFAKTAAKKAKASGDQASEMQANQLLERLPKEQAAIQQTSAPDAVGTPAAATTAAVPASAAVEQDSGVDAAQIESMVLSVVQNVMSIDDIALDDALMDAGMDSLSSVAFRNDLQKAAGINLSAALVFDYPTGRQVVDHIIDKITTRKKK